MASTPRAIERFMSLIRRPQAVMEAREITPPYKLPGYKPPKRMDAVDYLTPDAKWPLVWVMDTYGWTVDKATKVVSLTLDNGSGYGGQAAQAAMKLPYHEGNLFDREGTYVLVAIPAHDEELVRAIIEAAQ